MEKPPKKSTRDITELLYKLEFRELELQYARRNVDLFKRIRNERK